MANLIPIPKFIPNNTNLINYKTPTLTIKGTEAEVDATVNSIRQSWNTNIIRINSGSDSEGGVFFNFDFLEVGDYIELSCEIRVISGDKPVFKIAEFNPTTNEEYSPDKREAELTGEWHTLHLKSYISIFKGWYNNRAFIGIDQGKSGIFEIRGVRAIAYSKTQGPKPIKKDYVIRLIKTSGVFAVQAGGSDAGITLTKPYPYSFKLDYPDIGVAPIALLQTNKEKEFIIDCNPPSATSLSFSFGDITGKTVGDIDATMPNDSVVMILIKWV